MCIYELMIICKYVRLCVIYKVLYDAIILYSEVLGTTGNVTDIRETS